jgi:RNA polymerase sigma factor (sigma-70 family)
VTATNSLIEHEISEAVRAVRAGDTQAYATIVTRFQGPILTVCAAILRDRQAAEDLAQDVFVRAFQELDKFDPRFRLKPWLVKIAYRLAQQNWRRAKRQAARDRKAALAGEDDRHGENPAKKLLDAERSDALWQTVSSALSTVNLRVGVPASAGPDRLKAVLQPPDRTLTKH